MAITWTSRLSTTSTSNTTSYAGPTWTAAAGTYLVAFVEATGTVAAAPTFTNTGTAVLTWTLLTSIAHNTTDTTYVYGAVNASSNVISATTFTCTADAATACLISIMELAGHNTTAPIRQLATAAATGANPAVTLPHAILTTNGVAGIATDQVSPAGMTAPSGWSSQIDIGQSSPACGSNVSTRVSGETSTTITWTHTSASYSAIVIEFLVSGAGNVSGAIATGTTAAVLGNAYTITAVQGTYALTGEATGIVHNKTVAPVQGAYTLTGEATGLSHNRTVAPAQGAYALTGKATGIVHNRTIAPAQGAYTLTGEPVALKRGRLMPAAQGAYALAGEATALSHNRTIAPAQGAYALTGEAANLVYTPVSGVTYALYVACGTYSFPGNEIPYGSDYGIGGAGWVVGGVDVATSGGGTPPGYTIAADRLTANAGASSSDYGEYASPFYGTGRVAPMRNGHTYAWSVVGNAINGRWLALEVDQANWTSENGLDGSPGDDQVAWFDLVNGVVGSLSNFKNGGVVTATSSIESLGSGWYRCTIFTPSRVDSDLGVAYVIVVAADASFAGPNHGAVDEFDLADPRFVDTTAASGAVTFQRGHVLAPAQGAYALTGEATALSHSRTIAPARGAYALTGRAAALDVGHTLTATRGTYALTGEAAILTSLRHLTATAGAYALTGQPASFVRTKSIAPAQGAYALTGEPTGLVHNKTIAPAQGAYAVTGEATGLVHNRTIAPAQGAYAVTGEPVGLYRGIELAAAQGAYALTGEGAALDRGRRLTAAQGTYALAGQAVALVRSIELAIASGAYALTGRNVALDVGHTLTATRGAYALTGEAAALERGYRIAVVQGAYAVAGDDVGLIYTLAGANAYTLTAARGAYALAGEGVTLLHAARMATAPGAYALTGEGVSLSRGRTVAPAPGAYVTVGSDAALRRELAIVVTGGAYVLAGQAAALVTMRAPLFVINGVYNVAGGAAFFHGAFNRVSRTLPTCIVLFDDE